MLFVSNLLLFPVLKGRRVDSIEDLSLNYVDYINIIIVDDESSNLRWVANYGPRRFNTLNRLPQSLISYFTFETFVHNGGYYEVSPVLLSEVGMYLT